MEVYNATNRVEVHSGFTILLTATNPLNSSSWNHIAVTRTSGTLTIYINGVASGNVANANNFSDIHDLQIARTCCRPHPVISQVIFKARSTSLPYSDED
ncbi:MAG: hypothetical protein IPI76_05395 [Chloracidobacterium sp.]|nr:hypothetical protein [Chloracidobacterium sp.]